MADGPLTQPGYFPLGREWENAYFLVESYFLALRVNRPLILSQCTRDVLKRAAFRHEAESLPPSRLAMEEATKLAAEWFEGVMDEPLPENRLATRGRLALLLADMPGQWQDQFLHSGPCPDEFVERMRKSYLRAGPAFQTKTMAPVPIKLSNIMTFTSLGWEYLDRVPALRRLVSLVFTGGLLFLLILLLWF